MKKFGKLDKVCQNEKSHSIYIITTSKYSTMKQPKIVYWTWIKSIPQILSLITLIIVCVVFITPQKINHGVYLGASIFLLYSLSARQIIPRYHRRGIACLNSRNFGEALKLFELSKKFFEKYSWIDKYRSVVLMSPSVYSYHEMSMINIAFVCLEKDDVIKAEQYYREVTNLYPDNKIAVNTLKLIEKNKQN